MKQVIWLNVGSKEVRAYNKDRVLIAKSTKDKFGLQKLNRTLNDIHAPLGWRGFVSSTNMEV